MALVVSIVNVTGVPTPNDGRHELRPTAFTIQKKTDRTQDVGSVNAYTVPPREPT